MKTVKRETWKNERSRRTNTPTDLSGVFTPCVFFFFYKTPRWENCLPYNHSAGRWRPAAWFVRKAIYECDPVCARSESVYSHAFHFFVSHFLISLLSTSSLVNFFVSHFLSCSLSTSSLANFLTFSFSELSANRWEWVVGWLRKNTKAAIEESERKRA